MLAFRNTTVTKPTIMRQLRMHANADAIIKGTYWEDGKGCAVGCTIYSGNHAEYETRFGIPQMLACLEDCIFEGMPNEKALQWPLRFMNAVQPGVDLSRVGWQFLQWLLTNSTVNPGIEHPIVRDAIKQCADVLVPLLKEKPVDASAARAAAAAARASDSAARAAARAADSAAAAAADSAAWSAAAAAAAAAAADSAGAGAWSAARAAAAAAKAADSAAWSAARAAAAAAKAADSAAWSAAAAAAAAAADSAARAAYVMMANKLIVLIRSAPIRK